ncbi:MAG: hypothetical protein R2708_19645 [Vicinamibacterales bacterium]
MTTTRLRPALWMGLGVLLGTIGTSAWVQAQGGLVPDPRLAGPAPVTPLVLSGDDIGFEVRAVDGETPVVVPVVKRNGAWVEAALGSPTLRRLSK